MLGREGDMRPTMTLMSTVLLSWVSAAQAQTTEPAPTTPDTTAIEAIAEEATVEAAPAIEATAAPVVDAAPLAAPAEAEEVTTELSIEATPDEESAGPTWSGYIEAAYHFNASRPDLFPVARVYEGTGTAFGNGFYLHAAHLALGHSFSDRFSGVIELDVGSDAGLNSARGELLDVQEAYLSFNCACIDLSITAGKFVTYEGIEVIEGPLNPTITRGLLFGYAEAFTHVGVKIHYAPSDLIDVGLGVVNGWDQLVDNNAGKTVIGRVLLRPIEGLFFNLSGSIGPEQPEADDESNTNLRWSGDLTAGYTVNDHLTINVQANWGQELDVVTERDAMEVRIGGMDAEWFGFGLQPVVTLDDFTVGARFEMMHDDDGARLGTADINYYNVTLTPGMRWDGVAVRAEYRLDVANETVFNGRDTQHTAALSASYTF